MHYDVFNGDADGISALLQLRLAQPKSATLVTGIKRDIKLLKHVAAQSDVCGVTILDISMEKNIDALYSLIERDIPIFYCDHHRSGEVPQASHFSALINLDANTCTSLLINQHLDGRFPLWAITGAFGDNMLAGALELANALNLPEQDIEFLKELGTLINYNGYGVSVADLHIPPAELFQQLLGYPSPLMLRGDLNSPYYVLQQGYAQDAKHLDTLKPSMAVEAAAVFELPSEAWARRISGVFGNDLANQHPDRAHAVLTLNPSGQDYTVSVRAPLNNRVGADELCCAFPTGGGRKAAAGINQLPLDMKSEFIQAFTRLYQTQ